MPSATATERVFNFSPGPAVMPLSVLEQAQRELVCLPGYGMSLLEMSHRSDDYVAIAEKAETGAVAVAAPPKATAPSGADDLLAQLKASLEGATA